ncbi:MAG: hypothetical protein HQK84_02850 [Nitrospinae bacterium]|nr:hypothetical protein [Nitrospinota bacterium]
MMEIIDPKKYGITGKTLIKKVGNSSYLLEIKRKSRLIMADGKKIVDKVIQLRAIEGAVKVSLETNAPVCSKTIAFLKSNNIEVIVS